MIFSWVMVYLAAAIAEHALVMRLAVSGNSVARFVWIGGSTGLGLGLQMFVYHGPTMATFAALAVYAFACELYIFLFTLVGTSIGVKLLLALRESDLSPDQVETLCATTGLVNRRFKRMHAVGLLEWDGSGYWISPKGQRLVRTFLMLRQFFLPESAGQELRASNSREIESTVPDWIVDHPAHASRSPGLDTAPKALL